MEQSYIERKTKLKGIACIIDLILFIICIAANGALIVLLILNYPPLLAIALAVMVATAAVNVYFLIQDYLMYIIMKMMMKKEN